MDGAEPGTTGSGETGREPDANSKKVRPRIAPRPDLTGAGVHPPDAFHFFILSPCAVLEASEPAPASACASFPGGPFASSAFSLSVDCGESMKCFSSVTISFLILSYS